MKLGTAILTAALLAASATAQPILTSTGSSASCVSDPVSGTYYLGGSNARWTLNGASLTFTNPGNGNGSQISADGLYQSGSVANNGTVVGYAFTPVSPAFSIPAGPYTPVVLPATGAVSARYSSASGLTTSIGGIPNDAYGQALACFGAGDSGNVSTATNMSSDGRFIVSQAYISTYNAAGTAIVGVSSFRFRGQVWDANTNTVRVLPTPMRTTSPTTRRRDGTAWDVSTDGTVIVGAQDHNAGTTPASTDPDGGRLAVWRWNGSDYAMTYLPNGVNANGFPITYSTSIGTVHMNNAGTIIAGPAVSDAGGLYLAKWVWNSGTSTWNAPINIGSNLTVDASWLPVAVTSCTANQPRANPTLTITGMSEDGNTIVGFATYSTCGSFQRGGFIWTAGDGIIADWYDYLNAQGVAGLAPGASSTWGPIGDGTSPSINYTKGMPRLGNPNGISPDGQVIVGNQGGNQVIIGAQPWVLRAAGTPCVAPAINTSSTATVNFSRCSRFVNLTISARGTTPTFQWYRANGGSPIALTDGDTATGATITGANLAAFSMSNPAPADADNYYCVVSNACGSAQSANSVVQVDPAAITTNDTCATATAVGEGSFNFNICGGFVNDGFAPCAGATELADVWYVYTPTFTGDARFQTCGASFDSTLQLSSGCGGTNYDCNNDAGSRGIVGTTCSSTRSLISRFPVVNGVPIYVRVGGLTTNATGVLSITQAPARPVNDECANATSVGIGAHAFNLAEATDDYTFGTDICGESTNASNRDVWFLLNSPCGGTYTISTCGSTITNPMLHVMTDCTGSFLACNDNVGSGVSGCTNNQARIVDLVISGPVLIRVSASGTGVPNSGLGTLTITGTQRMCPCSADFDCDGDTGTDADIEAFFRCLGGNCPALPGCPHDADFDGDGDTGTDADIESFFRVLGGNAC